METNADKAFDLAYFILGDRASALEVTTSALRLCPSSILHKKSKRLEYGLRGRFLEGSLMKPFRTKLTPNEVQELQLLVYRESARYEETQEQLNGVDRLAEEDFIIRYIKHLVHQTTSRSSFYVSLGLCRLLFDYTTSGAMDIYETVMQDVERQKGEPYYGKQRLLLMKKFNERFGERLQIQNSRRTEMSFVKRADSERWFPLVEEALGMFTPWETCCVLPDGFHSVDIPIPSLASNGSHPDKEHPIEALRMHALLHLPCFTRLIASLRFVTPRKSLSLPQFFNVSNNGGEPRGRHGGGLLPDEREAIEQSLHEEGSRRRKASPEFVVVKIDGVERCRVDLNTPQPYRIAVDDGAGLMEIVGDDQAGELVLGNLLFASRRLPPIGKTETFFVSLAKGRELRVDFTSRGDEEGEYSGAALSFDYRERSWAALSSNLLARLSILTGFGGARWTWAKFARLAVTSSLILALVGSGIFFAYRHKQRPTNLVARVEPPFPDTPIMPRTPAVVAGGKEPGQKPDAPSPHSGINSAPRGGRVRVKRYGGTETAEDTRSLSAEDHERLAAINRIYVEEHPVAAHDAVMRATFIRQLSTTGRFVVVDDPQDADGFLLWKFSLRPKKSKLGFNRRRLDIAVTDKQQRVLWHEAREARDAAHAVETLVQDLVSKLRNASSN
jgi:hypothetical protein